MQVYDGDNYVLSKGGTFVGKGYAYGEMFKLNAKSNKDGMISAYMHVSTLNKSFLWHARLGHVNFSKLKEMSNLDLIPKLNDDIEKCKTCMLNKITKSSFSSVKRTSKLLDLIHSDLGDFHSTPSIGGKKYYVTFIDDYSRYCQVYLLSSKDETLEKFRVYKTRSELQCETLIKTLRSDRGDEYYDPKFFQETGIVHETTAPYTPQQNGVAERKNRTLEEMVNSMLSNSGLSNGFWGEAMLTACYILNRVPFKGNSSTPYELWNKRKPSLKYFKIWGCRAIVRVPEPKKRKLGERGL